MFAKMHYQILAYADEEDGIMALCMQQYYGKNIIKSIQFKIEISSKQKINENCQVNLK